MILDLRALKRSGKEEEDFFFEYSPKENLISIPNATLVPPIKVTGNVRLLGNKSCYLEGEICFSVKGECTRCLNETVRQFVFPFNEEIEEGDEESYPLINDRVDLTQIISDTVLLNMPISFLCKDDCEGIKF